LTGGKSECNANLAEGLATALVCFQDLEKLRDKETTTNKHCILISNSSPYSMPVTECYDYEGKNVEQLAAIFLEKNINLSIISPRKIPVLFEIFEKSGGDLGSTASKNYSKDPRHLVLLKGFSLKERPASPNMNQQPQTPQMPTQQANVPIQQPPTPSNMQNTNDQMTMGSNINMNNNPGRPNIPNIRQNSPMMQVPNQQQTIPGQMVNPPQFGVQGQQMGNFTQRPGNPQQQQQQQQQQRWIAPNQTRPPFIQGQGNMPNSNMMPGNMVQNNMMQQQQQPQQQQNQPNQNPPQNSALISQLTQPPNIGAMTPQQQAMARMAAMQNQQQNQLMMGNQANPNMNIMPNAMQNSPQMMPGNQQQQNVQGVQGVQGGIMTQQNQPQGVQQQMSELKNL
jgi:mediator of RNA polymerase II transcription subunit 25